MRVRSLPLLLAAAALAACATTRAPRAPDALVFWRIARADGAGGSASLLGTLHVARENVALDPAIDRALADADAVALEVAPEELKPGTLVDLVVSLGQLPPGRSLAELIHRRTLRKLEKRVAHSSVPLSTWERWEPWLVTMMLANDQLASSGFRAEAGVEPQVGARADAQHKPVRGLETAREQIERFDALPLATQELLLKDALKDPRKRIADDTIERAWRRGDLAALAREIFATPRGRHAAPFFASIYRERNVGFADDIARLIEGGGRWFVAIGAGHVVGPENVPALLAARGYRVERVSRTPPASTAVTDAPAIAQPSAP